MEKVAWGEFDYPIDSFEHGIGNWTFDPVVSEAEAHHTTEEEMMDRSRFTEVLYYHYGEKDGEPWIFIVKHANGYYVYFHASCDFTGFDCQGGGNICYAREWKNMWAFGLTDELRKKVAHLKDRC